MFEGRVSRYRKSYKIWSGQKLVQKIGARAVKSNQHRQRRVPKNGGRARTRKQKRKLWWKVLRKGGGLRKMWTGLVYEAAWIQSYGGRRTGPW